MVAAVLYYYIVLEPCLPLWSSSSSPKDCFLHDPDGTTTNHDNGKMSRWVVFSELPNHGDHGGPIIPIEKRNLSVVCCVVCVYHVPVCEYCTTTTKLTILFFVKRVPI